MNIFDTETGKNLGQIEDIKEVNMTAKSEMEYVRDEDRVASHFIHNPTYEMTFNSDKPIDIEEFYRVLGVDIANVPDAYDIQFVKFVQARKHKKRRINKKWLKRYGYKQMLVESKGWKIKRDTNGNIEFVK